MPSPEITISRAVARRFLVRTFALDGFQIFPDVPAAIDRLEFVQEDSINVCGRIHDLILWARVAGYTPADLHQTLYAHPRQAFEYYFPNLSALPIADYPYFAGAMQARQQAMPGRWHGLTDDELPIAERLLAAIDADGPLRTRATGTGDGYAVSGWGTRTTVAARIVEKLWLHGRLTVSHRENFERWFDRTERLLPHIGALTLPDAGEVERFRVRKRLRARRLFRLKPADRAFLGADAFAAVTIEGVPGRPWHILAEDVPILRTLSEASADSVSENETTHFLAPLDPLVYDRERNRALWDFDYIWEVYTPAAKRRWGYYALPILRGDALIGRIDPKVDRKTGTLTVNALLFEPGVDRRDTARAITPRLVAYARWLGASRIDLSPTGLSTTMRRLLEKALN